MDEHDLYMTECKAVMDANAFEEHEACEMCYISDMPVQMKLHKLWQQSNRTLSMIRERLVRLPGINPDKEKTDHQPEEKEGGSEGDHDRCQNDEQCSGPAEGGGWLSTQLASENAEVIQGKGKSLDQVPK